MVLKSTFPRRADRLLNRLLTSDSHEKLMRTGRDLFSWAVPRRVIVGAMDGGVTAHVLRSDARVSAGSSSSRIPNMSAFDLLFSWSWIS